MKFALSKSPFLRSKRSTTGIMLELFVVLTIVWLASVVTYSVRFDFFVGLRAMLIVLVSLFTTFAVDVIVALIKGKRNIKDIGHFVLTSYSYVTAIIFALCLPVGANFYAVVVGAIVATLLGKYVFGGFGYNIFNPAIIGRIFVGLAFGTSLNYGIVIGDSSGYDYVSGATVTGNIDWSNGIIPEGYDFKTLLFGNYNGAIGETFTLLLVIAAIYLIIRGIINFRLIGSYLITVASISLFLGLFYKVDNVLNYTLLQLITGGLMFGAVFMVTDPVTSPKSMNGKIIYGIGIGCLTMFIRVNSAYPEGVMFSIALMNMLTPLIDSCIKGNTFDKLGVKWAIIGGFLVGSIGLNVGFNALYPLNKIDESNKEEEKEDPNKWLENYNVTKVGDGVYTVKSSAFDGDLELKVYVDILNKVIDKVEILDVHTGEYYHQGIEYYPDYDIFVGENLNLEFEQFDNFACNNGVCNKTGLENTGFDVEAGATYTSSAFIGNLKAIVETVRSEYKWLENYPVAKIEDGIYTVKSSAFDGDLELKVYVDIFNKVIDKVEILDVHFGEYYHQGIEYYPDYDTFVGEDLNLDFEQFDNFTCNNGVCKKTGIENTDFDVEAGATYTSSAFIGNLKAIVDIVKCGGEN